MRRKVLAGRAVMCGKHCWQNRILPYKSTVTAVFAPHWDTRLLQMYADIGDARAVITHYPMGFDTETGEQDHLNVHLL